MTLFDLNYFPIGPTFKYSQTGHYRGFPGDSVVKNPPGNAGDARDSGSIPQSGRSPGEGNDYPFLHGECHGQRSLVVFHGVTKSQTQLRD